MLIVVVLGTAVSASICTGGTWNFYVHHEAWTLSWAERMTTYQLGTENGAPVMSVYRFRRWQFGPVVFDSRKVPVDR